MESMFFPGPVFGWIYLSILLALLLVAAYIDLRWVIIPKWLTISALGLAFVFNIARGIWLGSDSASTWILPWQTPWGGALDGLLFALTGAAFGFALYFLMWIIGACGGGDVKLSTALGAWIGPYLFIWVLIATIVMVGVLAFAQIAWGLLSGKGVRLQKLPPAKAGRSALQVEQSKRRKLVFSLPLAIACIVVLPWLLRNDLWKASQSQTSNAHVQLQTR